VIAAQAEVRNRLNGFRISYVSPFTRLKPGVNERSTTTFAMNMQLHFKLESTIFSPLHHENGTWKIRKSTGSQCALIQDIMGEY
jgi:hypothetical protein